MMVAVPVIPPVVVRTKSPGTPATAGMIGTANGRARGTIGTETATIAEMSRFGMAETTALAIRQLVVGVMTLGAMIGGTTMCGTTRADELRAVLWSRPKCVSVTRHRTLRLNRGAISLALPFERTTDRRAIRHHLLTGYQDPMQEPLPTMNVLLPTTPLPARTACLCVLIPLLDHDKWTETVLLGVMRSVAIR